jgi:hypothetical protein
MVKYIKYLFFVFLIIAFVSCSKEQVKRTIEKKIDTQVVEDDADTTSLSPEESFSQALVNNILDTEDEDLQVYLEDEIYPLVKSSNKVTIDNISSSLYLLQYDDKGNTKNILIQKFYNPEKDDFFFEKREVQNDAIKQFIK